MSKFKVGDIVRVTADTSCHRYPLGKLYQVYSATDNATFFLKTFGTKVRGNADITGYEMELASRAAIADFLEAGVLSERKAAIEKLEYEIVDIEKQIEGYRRFPDIEAERAYLISEIFKTGGDPDAIAAILRSTNLFGEEGF